MTDRGELEEHERAQLERDGIYDPGRLEWEREHDERLEERDRRDEKGPFARIPGARDALLTLYPDRPVTSQVTPLGRRAA